MSKKHVPRASLTAQPAPWAELVVCQKCLRRQGRDALRGDLRKALKHAGRRDIRPVLVGCMDLCPDDGVAIARASTLAAQPPHLHVLDNRASAEELARWVLG